MKNTLALISSWLSGFTLLLGQAEPLNLGQILDMETSEKVNFYKTLQPKKLVNSLDFIPALSAGLLDKNIEVRAAAANKALYLMMGLQQIKRQKLSIPVTAAEISDIQNNLVALLDDPNPEVSNLSMLALIYSDAPNKEFEQILSKKLINVVDVRTRVSLAKNIANAGYSLEIVDRTLIDALNNTDSSIRSHAASAIASVKPDGALPKLASLLDDQEMLRGYLVRAISSYGSEASYLLPILENMLDDSTVGGTLPNDIRKAINRIKNPQSQTVISTPIKTVSLIDVSRASQELEIVKESTFKEINPSEAAIEAPEKVLTTEPVEEGIAQSSNRWLWLAAAVLVVGGLSLAVRRRG